MTEKRCNKCGLVKPIDQFYKNRKNGNNYQSQCKDCKRLGGTPYQNQKYKNDPDFRRKKIQKSSKRQADLKYDTNQIAHRKNYDLMKDFGITLDQYNDMVKKQNNKCAICGQTSKHCLAVDHNHSTNKIRGLLCKKCNAALGMLYADLGITVLQRAISYIKENDNDDRSTEEICGVREEEG